MTDDTTEAKLLRFGAFSALWVLGLCAILKLLTQFEATLKPLILAVLMSALLEWVVQCFEWLLFKFKLAMYVLIDQVTVVMAIVFFSGVNCLAGTRWRETAESSNRRVKRQLERLGRHDALNRSWEPAFAGQNQLSRLLSVLLTIVLLVVVATLASYAISNGVDNLLHNTAAYKEQSLRIVRWVQNNINDLPDRLTFLPEQERAQVKSFLDSLGQRVQPLALASQLETQLMALLAGVVDSTSAWATQFVFFLLYVFLFLFCPLHINADENWKEKYVIDKRYTIAYKVSRLFKRTTAGSLDAPLLAGDPPQPPEQKAPRDQQSGTPVAVVELQHRIYRIMWQYSVLMVAVNTTFGSLTWLLLWYLEVPMATLVGILCFFLAFIPELGAIISILLPIPIIILMPPQGTEPGTDDDPFPDWQLRLKVLVGCIVGMLVNKLIVANVLNPLLMGRSKVLSGALSDEQDPGETHPVLLLFIVVVAGEVWGAIGMLISVPVVSFVRLAVNVFYASEAELKAKSL
mmetsp:Transcript_24786/g.45458  ORF Transcript_24786/g.45458 Transcript_24786/m.45458 type:complete len:517 (-) Transcript_24786:354-1904(-)